MQSQQILQIVLKKKKRIPIMKLDMKWVSKNEEKSYEIDYKMKEKEK